MKKISFIGLLFLVTCLNSCSVIGDIFKAGVWVGVLAVVAVVGVIIYLISRVAGKK